MRTEFKLLVTYGQLVVFASDDPYFNLWTPDHTAQGFAWRNGSVSFGVPDHNGRCRIEVDTPAQSRPLTADALRAIVVPFNVPSAPVMVGSVSDEQRIWLNQGHYQLQFTMFASSDAENEGFRIALDFVASPSGSFRILKRDQTVGAEMTSETVLRTDADAER